MTDLLTTDNADSGEIVRLHPSIVDTEVLDATAIAGATRSLTGYAKALPPTRFLRRAEADADETVEMYIPTTIAVISDPLVVTAELPLQTPGQPRPPAPLPTPPPKPTVVKPLFGHGRHRRPFPPWARRAVLLGLGSVGTVMLELAGLAALAVLR